MLVFWAKRRDRVSAETAWLRPDCEGEYSLGQAGWGGGIQQRCADIVSAGPPPITQSGAHLDALFAWAHNFLAW